MQGITRRLRREPPEQSNRRTRHNGGVPTSESAPPFSFELHTRLRDSPSLPEERVRENGGQFQARTGT
ncbi:tRNA-guanine(34) transglycosylase, partial [Mannheimia haemolytica]